MEREELGSLFWKFYKEASLERSGRDVGEWEDLDESERESCIDALELIRIFNHRKER